MVAGILAFSVCLGFLFCFFIPIQQTTQKLTPPVKRKLNIHDFVETKALNISIMGMIVSFSYASIMSFISTYAESKHLLNYASLFFIVFAISMMSLRPITGKIYDRLGASYVIYPAIILFSLGLMILSQIQSLTGLLVAAVCVGMGFGSAQPCLQTLAIQGAEKHRIGHATSTFFTMYDLGIALGSVLLGLLISKQGYSFTYLFCALTTVLSLLFYAFIANRKKTA